MREIVFDTETTGLSFPGGDRLVEIGARVDDLEALVEHLLGSADSGVEALTVYAPKWKGAEDYDAVAAASGKPPADLKDAKRRGMAVHGRRGQACPVCGDEVRSVFFADNSLEYCPTCQTGGKLLADRRLSRLLK